MFFSGRIVRLRSETTFWTKPLVTRDLGPYDKSPYDKSLVITKPISYFLKLFHSDN